MINKNEKEHEYYLTIQDKRGKFVTYCSDKFKLTELDIINLLKLCYVDRRSKTIGEKVLAVYIDSMEIFDDKDTAIEKLNKIGIKHDGNKPIQHKSISK